jgi:hypothetical protein
MATPMALEYHRDELAPCRRHLTTPLDDGKQIPINRVVAKRGFLQDSWGDD